MSDELVKKHGCPTCRKIADFIIAEGRELVENGKAVGGSEGRARVHAGIALGDVGQMIAMDSANTPMTANIAELSEIRLFVESALAKVDEGPNS